MHTTEPGPLCDPPRGVFRRALSSPDDTPAGDQQESDTVPVSLGNRPTGSDRPDALSGADPEGQPDSEGYELPIDRVFKLLKNSRRRATLSYLNDNGGKATLSEVAEYIAAVENETTQQAITSQQRKRVYVGLYQSHLPKMDDAAVVEFEQNRGMIRRGPNAAQLEPYLTVPDHNQTDRLYLGIALGSILPLIVAWGGTDPLSSIPAAIGVVTLVGLAAVTGTHCVADVQ